VSAARRACALVLLVTTVFVGACGRGEDETAKASRRSDDSEDCNTGGRSASDCSGRVSTTASSTTTTAPPPPTEPPTTEPPPPPTTVPPTTTTAPPPPPAPEPPPPDDGTLRPGDGGDAVLALQNRLVELGYWLGEADGGYGLTTQQAVLAFQKAEGLGRDGVAGPETQGRLATAVRPTAAGSGNSLEFDLERQLMFVITDGQVAWVLNTSTGKSSTPTPPGDFTISRQIDGYRQSELGLLYRPKYFNQGIAIHGYTSIPGYPASHGCTRLSNPAMDWLWSSGYAEIGTPVWVH